MKANEVLGGSTFRALLERWSSAKPVSYRPTPAKQVKCRRAALLRKVNYYLQETK